MFSRMRKRTLLGRKIHVLRSLASSETVENNVIFTDALDYIQKLIIRLEGIQRRYSNLVAIKREYLNPMKHFHEVQVEKLGVKTFLVKVNCKKEGDRLVSVLEALDAVGLDVVQARVLCKNLFAMEAIAISTQDRELKVSDASQSVIEAIEEQAGEGIQESFDVSSLISQSCDS